MAFETNTFGGTEVLSDLMGILRTFMINEGWTVVGAGPAFRASKGSCFVNLAPNIASTMNDLYGPSGSTVAPDHRIEGILGATAAAVSPTSSDQRVIMNDLTPPYANYWLFSGDEGAGDSPYVHLVVQKANGRFTHMSFGEVDKKGADYYGGAYLTASYYKWGFTTNTPSFSTYSDDGSDPFSSNHQWLFHANANGSYGGHNVFMGDLDPGVVVSNNANSNFANGKIAPVIGSGAHTLEQSTSLANRWLGQFFYLGPNPINGVTPLFEVPVLRYFTPNQRLYFLGTMPGFRSCSMIGRNEAETVSFASDEYIIFPLKRALPWNPEPWAQRIITSGPLGFAVKKVA